MVNADNKPVLEMAATLMFGRRAAGGGKGARDERISRISASARARKSAATRSPADEIKAFAREFDPQPFHLDEEAAARSHFGALCASGWHTAAVCLRHVVLARQRQQAELRRCGEPVARTGPSPGLRDLKWPRPVYVGDTIASHRRCGTAHGRQPARRWPARRPPHRRQPAGRAGLFVLSSTFIERRVRNPDGAQA